MDDAARFKKKWDAFVNGRTKVQMSIALNKTIAGGTAQGGSTTHIDLDVSDQQADDYFNDMELRTTGGTGANQEGTITDYDSTLNRATVTFSTAPSTDTTYKIDRDVGNLIKSINNANKSKRILNGEVTQTPAKDLLAEMRMFG